MRHTWYGLLQRHARAAAAVANQAQRQHAGRHGRRAAVGGAVPRQRSRHEAVLLPQWRQAWVRRLEGLQQSSGHFVSVMQETILTERASE